MVTKRGATIDYLIELISGPGTFRFLIQPVLAIILGVRDGRNDAKASTPPILYMLLLASGKRREALKGGLHAIALPLILAVALDSILQIYIFGVWRLQWALVVGVGLVGIPYILSRGITNRIISARHRKEATSQ